MYFTTFESVIVSRNTRRPCNVSKRAYQCILPTLRVLLCIRTLVCHVMCLKRLIPVPFERSEPFHLLRLMGVLVPSLHIESTDCMILLNRSSVHINIAFIIPWPWEPFIHSLNNKRG